MKIKLNDVPKVWLEKAQKLTDKLVPYEEQEPSHGKIVDQIALLMYERDQLMTACKQVEDPVINIPKMVTCLFELRELIQSNQIKIQTKDASVDKLAGGIFARIDEVLTQTVRPPLTEQKPPASS